MSEEFGSNIDEKRERGTSNYRKTNFLKFTEGEHTVRILESRETKHYTHYMGFAYVKCLGDECPICANNKKILYEHPEDFREVKGWNPRRDRYYINVMDKTVAKVCPKCGTEASASADACPACGTLLEAAKPLNIVKVMTGSKTFFEDLKVLYKSVRNEQDEIVPITHYDWVMVTRGKKTDKTTAPSPRYNPAKAGVPEFNAEDLYDLEKVVVTLTPEEMLDVFNGASLKDIFTVRRAKKQSEKSEVADTELAAEVNADIKSAVDEIFQA